ncbi:hypothetical protein L9F63_007257, partial [Diploptera punctata]
FMSGLVVLRFISGMDVIRFMSDKVQGFCPSPDVFSLMSGIDNLRSMPGSCQFRVWYECFSIRFISSMDVLRP